MSTRDALELGLAAIIAALLIIFVGGGCIATKSLRSVVAELAAGQGQTLEGISALDEACQTMARDAAGLERCREPRDRARAGLRRQSAALGSLLGGAP